MLLVDTSVWSLALRRDTTSIDPRVEHLERVLVAGDDVATTGLILQEVLQGIRGPRHRGLVLERLGSCALVQPERRDHIDAAELRNRCRRSGVQIGTVDALLIALCLRHGLTMLSADRDFGHAATVVPLDVWSA